MIGIILLNWNSFQYTKDCIESILKTQKKLAYKIYLVDNKSSDDSFHKLKLMFSNNVKIDFIQSGGNWGYARGNNFGIINALESGCNYICIANNDLVFQKTTISSLLNVIENNSDIGIVGGKILFAEEPFLIWAAGGKFNWVNASGRGVGNRQKDIGQFDKAKDVDYIPGALFLMRAELIRQTFLLPECYFLGGEELDLCLKLKSLGYRNYYTPESVCFHNVGYSRSVSPKYKYNRFRNRLLVIKRNYSALNKMFVYLYFINRNIIVNLFLQYFIKKRKSDFVSALHAICDHFKFEDITIEHLEGFQKSYNLGTK
jgi:GT2 family glycosyltransferase